MGELKREGDLLESTGSKKATKISDRKTAEMVIGLVGPVGSGLVHTYEHLRDLLIVDFGYEVSLIKLSDIIRECASLVGEGRGDGLGEHDRINHLQTVGNMLREKFGGDYLARKAIRKIATDRQESGLDTDAVPVPRRKVFIIDSIKHPSEAALFRDIYRDMFWLIGVFAPDGVRIERLQKSGNGMEMSQAAALMKRDYDEQNKLGQKVSKAFSDCDFFIHHADANPELLKKTLKRYMDILFCTDLVTPTAFESAMYKASSISSNSGCLSRKVGAAIIDADGELISVGWNDVPKFGGGLYGEDDKSGHKNTNCDHRCYNFAPTGCRNDKEKDLLITEIVTMLGKAKVLQKGKTAKDVLRAIEGSRIEALIEFSRAIHAEMEAILAAARSGRGKLKGARLFVTTFPCHSCARHIIAAGIHEVQFIEPYPKSKALDLHNDAASLDPREASGKVIFKQYEGISPKNVYRFFKTIPHEKTDGRVSFPGRKVAMPRFAPYLDSFTLYEGQISVELASSEASLSPIKS